MLFRGIELLWPEKRILFLNRLVLNSADSSFVGFFSRSKLLKYRGFNFIGTWIIVILTIGKTYADIIMVIPIYYIYLHFLEVYQKLPCRTMLRNPLRSPGWVLTSQNPFFFYVTELFVYKILTKQESGIKFPQCTNNWFGFGQINKRPSSWRWLVMYLLQHSYDKLLR